MGRPALNTAHESFVDHAHHHAPAPLGIGRLVAGGTLDGELGALLWILVEFGIPVLICGGAAEGDLTAVATALSENAPSRDLADRPGRKPATTLHAASLREAFDTLGREPFNLSDDEQRTIGLVCVIQDGRATAVHYVRPVERDGEGHLQRRPPAVLATWDAERNRFEHFAWAITPELAARIGMTQAELEDLQRERAHVLSHAVPAPVH